MRSGVLPDYLKTTQNSETLGTTTVNSRSKIISQTGTIPPSVNIIHEHSSPSAPHVPFQEHSHHHLLNHHNQNLYQNNQNTNSHHNSLQNQNILSSVTAVTTTVSGGGGNGGGDETRDHSELFDISTTTNTRKTYKLSQKNSENVSGSSSFRFKKGKGWSSNFN